MKLLILAVVVAIALTLTAAIPAAQSKRSCSHPHRHASCPRRSHRTNLPPRVRGGVPPRTVAAVGVHESEFRITLTRAQVAAGSVVVEAANDGEDAHDLHLVRDDGSGSEHSFPVAKSGSRRARTLTLTPGRWRLWCTLQGHEAAGMHATLIVATR